MRRTFRLLGLVGVGLLAAIAMPMGATASTPPPITFQMSIYDSCLAGLSAHGATINVTWRDSAGMLKTKGSVVADSYGEWTFCGTGAHAVMPGDLVKVTDGAYIRNYVVPNLTIRADRVSQTYEGTGPAGRTIKLWIPNGDWERSHAIRVTKDGSWSFAPMNGLGGSYITDYTGYVEWTSPNSDRLSAFAFYPTFGVTLGKSGFYGTTGGFGDVTATISGARDGQGTATGNGAGDFQGVFSDSSGKPVVVSPGDRVTAPAVASDADFVVPEIQGSVDKTTEVVSGKCFDTGTAANYVGVTVVRPGGHVRGASTWDIAPDGTFVADFSDFTNGFSTEHANIKTGDRIKVNCFQTTGDFARLTFVVK
jgi:hypothetical protein